MSAVVPPADSIALTHLPRALADLTGASPPPTYRRCHTAAVNAAIPVMLCHGRYFVAPSDLPAIAKALGLRVPAAAAPTGGRRRKSAEMPATAD